MTEDEMVRWHQQLDVHEFEQTLGVGDGQGSLAVLQSMGSQRARQVLVNEQQQQNSICQFNRQRLINCIKG